MADSRVLVAGPYVGEFGWECFGWQPLVRGEFYSKGYPKCVVYTRPGHRLMYRFADEVRTLSDIPAHESECMAWADLPSSMADLNNAMSRVKDEAVAEFGENGFVLLNYTSLKKLNDPHYGAGYPDLLYPDDGWEDRMGHSTGFGAVNGPLVLAVRDRSMADHRNWPYENWYRLAELLVQNHTVVVVGIVREPEKWKAWPDGGVVNLLNRTTVDDLIGLCSRAEAVVGGSSGTMHLASRCGADHLVWGAEHSTIFPLTHRYAETNWFGARCRVLTQDAWSPDPMAVKLAVEEFTR